MKRDTEDWLTLAALVALGYYLLSEASSVFEQSTVSKIGPMGKGQVPAVKTRVALEGLEELFHQAVHNVLGPAHGGQLPRMLVAQTRVECGSKLESCYHYNFGNVTTTGSDGQWYLNPPSDIKRKYAVYNMPLQGAEAMVDWIHRRCPNAIAPGEVGFPGLYAKELKKCGYYEATVERYAAALAKLYEQNGS